MKLTRVRVRNFRSLWSEGDEPSAEIELCPGGNYFAGPNNAGKSNLFRALELALRRENEAPFDAARDSPEKKLRAYPTITLDFEADRRTGPLRTLYEYAHAYEETVAGVAAETFASRGLIRYYVQYGKGGARTELLLANGAGARKGDFRALNRALDKFHEVVRFVDIRSGEDLERLLQRGFVEIIGSVLKEKFAAEMAEASRARDAYIENLSSGLLSPVAKHVESQIRKYVPDVSGVVLAPRVPSIEEAVAAPHCDLLDPVRTSLDQKGTGVRSAILLTVMSFIAEASRRAVVFAIEEPESFLHPAAHPELGRALEAFTKRPDISLLVTTHSPLIISGTAGKVFAVSKRSDGKTEVTDTTSAAATVSVRKLLVGSERLAATLTKLDAVPPDTNLLVVVEGGTDKTYLQAASELLKMPLTGIHIVECEGAEDAAFKALSLRELFGAPRVVVLLDSDEPGQVAIELLVKKLKWQNKTQVLSYGMWVASESIPAEAEDLFPEKLLKSFLGTDANGYLTEKVRRPRSGLWHVGLNEAGKIAFIGFLKKNAKASDYEIWGKVIATLQNLAAKAAASPVAQPKQRASTTPKRAAPATTPSLAVQAASASPAAAATPAPVEPPAAAAAEPTSPTGT